MSDPDTDHMTDAQRQCLEKAYETLGEHFDRVLIVVSWDTDDKGEAKNIYWSGGWSSALGLTHYAQDRLLHNSNSEEEP